MIYTRLKFTTLFQPNGRAIKPRVLCLNRYHHHECSPKIVAYLNGVLNALIYNIKRIFFRLSEIWKIFSRNMIKCHIISRAETSSENMWHFMMLSENIYHISRKTKKLPFYFIIKENWLRTPLLATQLQLYSAQ
jgi:hypothetical protein